MPVRFIVVLMSVLALAGCERSQSPPVGWTAEKDQGLAWVKHAAEFQALSLQAYHQAERALPGFIEDKSWSALPGQSNAGDLAPAIIFDVDETVVTGVSFQLSVERPVNQTKLNQWNSTHEAQAVEGFARFANAAHAAGVELFFLTNRPCERIDGVDDPCPYKTTVINDIREAGFDVAADHVQLSYEQDDWTKEKLVRRELLAQRYRIIMLLGDDLSDFIPCVRSKPATPCTEPGTVDGRKRSVAEYADYWGNGWYILPNPMHGSWLSIR